MKRILVNALTLKEGGAEVVLKKLILPMVELASDIDWIVITSHHLRNIKIDLSNVKFICFPFIEKNGFFLSVWTELYLALYIKRKNVDALFSLTNTLPIFFSFYKKIVLIHHAGYFSSLYEEKYFEAHKKLKKRIIWKIKKKIAEISARKADLIFVQTEALKSKLVQLINRDKSSISVISHGPGVVVESFEKRYCQKDSWNLSYVTKYGVQKDFVTLFNALTILVEKGMNVKLILTINSFCAEFEHVNEMIKARNIQNNIINYGDVSHEEVSNLYLKTDIFVYPSLCESFGFTLVEAMRFGIPVVASDTDSNRELIGGSGIFFDQQNEKALANAIVSLMVDGEKYNTQSCYIKKRGLEYSWDKAVHLTLHKLREQ